VVTPTLERQKAQQAVAVKFEAAYLRGLDFGPASESDAAHRLCVRITCAWARPMGRTAVLMLSD
jgi:hypothetical protein